ncbi:glycoside hydrolase family 127 protein [Lachnospiraceae bacterium OttesenSCG-928-D06]|nr:glycoside hydrolase family 127 protein [Lachnospiraceae bacterium OttesenSCG-928-D06]
MNQNHFSTPVNLKKIQVEDDFWKREQELVRKEVIPYQWEALNDRVPHAAPSYCMHNFKAAARIVKAGKEEKDFIPPVYTNRGFEALPEEGKNPEPDHFYGFLFQDSDFYKWIEAVAYSLMQHEDSALETVADEAIEIVCAAQLPNGYLDTYYIINGMDRAFTNLRDHHELYCLGHLLEAAVAYYQATGKDKLLQAAKAYADYVDSVFGIEEGKCKGYPGHEIAEMALVRLYEVTKEEKYLNLSKFFLEERGTKPYYFAIEEKERAKYENHPYKESKEEKPYAYHQAHEPVREQKEAVGHSVRAVYLYSGMADVAKLTGDEELFQACVRLFHSISKEKMYITGGIGGTVVGEAFSFPFDLPNDTAYAETCASIGLIFFARRMLQIQPSSYYADVMERALYNGALSGMALDGKSFFYVNPLEVLPEACKKDARKSHVKETRQKWFGCACCPPNIARLLSSVSSYAYTENEDTLWTHLYMGSTLTKTVGDKELDIHTETDFPFRGNVKVSLHGEESVKCTLAYRIPGWAKKCKGTIKVNNQEIKWAVENNVLVTEGTMLSMKEGYLYITANWKTGDSLSFRFPMEIRMEMSDMRVRENVSKVAFSRGPIVYCMEEIDNGKNLHLLRVDKKRMSKEDRKFSFFQDLGHPAVKIEVPGIRMKERITEEAFTEYTQGEEVETTLSLIPYYAWNNRGVGEMTVWISI